MRIITTILVAVCPFLLFAQNAIVGTGFTPGWGGACGTNTDFEYFSPSAGASYIRTENANATGNQYFRLGVDWGGTRGQHTINIGTDVSVSENTEYALNATCTTSGAMLMSVTSTSDNYVFKTFNAGSSPSFQMIFFRVQGAISEINSVTATMGIVHAGQSNTINATLNTAFSTGQSAYLRYSTDFFATSTIVEMTGAGTNYSATIPGSVNTAGTTVSYYCFTSGPSLASNIDNSEADWYSINLNNNGGGNYSYSVSNYANVSNGVGGCDGKWSTNACWLNGSVPPSGAAVTILENMELDIAAVTVSNITINGGKTLTCEPGSPNVLTIQNGGSITCNGSFAPNIGVVTFAGSGTISGNMEFYDVNIAGGVDFGASSLVTGTFQINTGGFVGTNSPSYEVGSTLRYNTGGTYARSAEWNANTPWNVTIGNNTTINLSNGSNAPRALDGDLFIIGGSSLNMQSMTGSLTVGGALTNSGTLTLSNAVGGDMYLAGDFTQSGTFNCNDRSVTFNGGGGIQGLLGGGTLTIDYLVVDNGLNGIYLNRDITVDNNLNLNAGSVVLDANNLNLSAGATVTAGGSNRVIATGVGMLRKYFNSAGSFTYNVGDGGVDCPVFLNVNSLSGAGYIGVNVSGSKHPSNTSMTDYLNRYWTVEKEAGITAINYNITLQYDDADVVGTESNLYGGKYSFGDWDILSAANAGSNTFTGTGLIDFSEFTGGEQFAFPVSLITFKAVAEENCVMLKWETASEINSSHFELERSPNAHEWKRIGQVAGAGYTTDFNTYSFPDEKPMARNFYRLKQVDLNGAVVYSNVLMVEFGGAYEAPKVFPNPVHNDLFVQLPDADVQPLARIFDLTGKLVQSSTMVGNSLNVQAMTKGTYILQITDGQGQELLRQRIVKL